MSRYLLCDVVVSRKYTFVGVFLVLKLFSIRYFLGICNLCPCSSLADAELGGEFVDWLISYFQQSLLLLTVSFFFVRKKKKTVSFFT